MQAWNDNLVALRMPRHATSLADCLLSNTSKELRVQHSKCRTKLNRERKLLKNLVHMEKIRSDTAKMIWVNLLQDPVGWWGIARQIEYA